MPSTATTNTAVTALPVALGILGSLTLLPPFDEDTPGSNSSSRITYTGTDGSNLTEAELETIGIHAPFGLPDEDNLLIRPGYVSSYDEERKIPQWVAYHIKPEFLETATREGPLSTFRVDQDIVDPVRDRDYRNTGYARGHLAPYGVMGGDRDEDGKTAADGDEDEFITAFSSNYMSNMAPQWHDGFNGNSGLWYNLERWIQTQLVKKEKREVWVIAGCIFTTENPEGIGPRRSINVPDMFYKILTLEVEGEMEALCFLFPHRKLKRQDLTHFMVSVDFIESLADLDFFSNSDFDEAYEAESSRQRWIDRIEAALPTRTLRP